MPPIEGLSLSPHTSLSWQESQLLHLAACPRSAQLHLLDAADLTLVGESDPAADGIPPRRSATIPAALPLIGKSSSSSPQRGSGPEKPDFDCRPITLAASRTAGRMRDRTLKINSQSLDSGTQHAKPSPWHPFIVLQTCACYLPCLDCKMALSLTTHS
jgi:hypothetical protein